MSLRQRGAIGRLRGSFPPRRGIHLNSCGEGGRGEAGGRGRERRCDDTNQMCWILYPPLLHRPLSLLVCFAHFPQHFNHFPASSRVPHEISAGCSGALHECVALTDWWQVHVCLLTKYGGNGPGPVC